MLRVSTSTYGLDFSCRGLQAAKSLASSDICPHENHCVAFAGTNAICPVYHCALVATELLLLQASGSRMIASVITTVGQKAC